MAVKPLEKTSDGAALKVGLLVFLLLLGFIFSKITESKNKNKDLPEVLSSETEKIDLKEDAENLAENVLDKSQDLAGQVMGETTEIISNVASQSSNIVANMLIDKASEPILEQIKKLPQSQQEEIKKNICN
jgi:predicted PurR-regulated permease PerM